MVNKKILIIVAIIALLATSVFAASFEVRHKTNTTATTTQSLSVHLQIYNNSGASVAMNTLKVRYYYAKEGTSAEQFTCDWAQIGNSLVNATFATGYVEIGFTGGTIANGANSGEVQTRINKTDWSNYDQSNDYSFAAVTSYTANSKICLYQNGNLVWGTPSGGTIVPTATAVVTTPPAGSGVGRISVSPASQSVAPGARPVINLLCNSGTQMVAAYGVTVTYPAANLSVAAADVVAGAQGFVSAVNTGTAGSIVASGFDTAGKGPGTALDLLKITFTANAAGTASIGVTVQSLTDASYVNIGTPAGVGGTITITGTTTATPVPRTATRTATAIVTTAGVGVGRISVSPASQTAAVNARPVINLLCNSGTQMVAAYGLTVTYPTANLSVAAADVVAGAQGFVSAVNTGNAGSIVASGFDTAGKGPGAALDLLKITFTAIAAGTANLGLTVESLTDASYANIGTPAGVGGTITISGPTGTAVITPIPRTATRTVVTTATRTAVVTATRTAVTTATRTAVVTATPTTSTGGCTAISVPFTKDGSGTFCWTTTSLCTYINSWNLTTLTINGTSYLNTYVASSSIPAASTYTINYVSTVSWAHFEIAGTCGGTTVIPPTATPVVTTPAVTTPVQGTGVGRISVSPASQTVAVNARPVINLLCNSGTQMVAAYGVTVTYPAANLSVAAADVVAGAQGFVSAVNVGTAGSIVASGFDTAGKGPGAALDLLKITFTATAAGTASLGVTVQSLTDAAYANIGTPAGVGGTITITGPTTTIAPTATPVPRTATRTVVTTATRTAVVTATRTAVVTATPAPTATPNAGTGVGRISVSPASQSVAVAGRPVINLLCNSGTQMVAAYGVTVTYPAANLAVVAADVVAGAQGFVSAVNVGTAGSIVASGFDTAGKGPGSALDLLKITFTANAAGTASIGLTVQSLTDAAYANIGTPSGVGGTITITGATVAPTVAPTATPVPRTATRTATVAPTATPVPRTATRTATVAPTVAPTATPVPRTATRTATVAPTVAPTATPVANVVGKVTLLPATQTAARGATVTQTVSVNTGTDMLAAYGITIAYSSTYLSITTAGVTAGAQGYVSAVNANTAGSLVISGFDTAGKGPSATLALLNIAWTASSTAGTSTQTLTVQSLNNASYGNIGTPTGSSASITLN